MIIVLLNLARRSLAWPILWSAGVRLELLILFYTVNADTFNAQDIDGADDLGANFAVDLQISQGQKRRAGSSKFTRFFAHKWPLSIVLQFTLYSRILGWKS